MANGNGGSRGNLGAIIVGAIAIFLSLANGFWSIANPRTDISDLNKKIEHVQRDVPHEFLTLREFTLYKEPTERRLSILETSVVQKEFFSESNKARESQIARVAERLGIVEQTTVPKDTLAAMQSRIDRQDARIERLETWFKESRNARSVGAPQ